MFPGERTVTIAMATPLSAQHKLIFTTAHKAIWLTLPCTSVLQRRLQLSMVVWLRLRVWLLPRLWRKMSCIAATCQVSSALSPPRPILSGRRQIDSPKASAVWFHSCVHDDQKHVSLTLHKGWSESSLWPAYAWLSSDNTVYKMLHRLATPCNSSIKLWQWLAAQ